MKKIISALSFILVILLLVSCNSVKYTVEFDLNGGVGNIKTQKVIKGGYLQEVEEPTKEGYEFNDWYYNDEAFSFESRIVDNMVLVAKWDILSTHEKEFIVTFDTNGSDETVDSITVSNGKKVVRPFNPTKEGYLFVRWNYNNQPFDFNSSITENITLVAEWILESSNEGHYIVIFETDGGLKIDPIEKALDSKLSKPITNKEGYILVGWYKDDEFEFEWDFNLDTIIGNTVIYVRWSVILSERTQMGIIRGELQADVDFNNAVNIGLEPSYFNVIGHKGTNNRPGIYDEIRMYPGSAITFNIHESFKINKIVISNNSSQFTITSGGQTLTNLDNLEINSFNFANRGTSRVDTNYIEIYYYQIGPDVLKEDDINRPTFDIEGINLYEKLVGETFTNPTLIAFDEEDLDIVGIIDYQKSDSINPNQDGIYYIHYYATDSDGNIGYAYITVIYRKTNDISNYYGNLLSKPNNQLKTSISTLMKTTINEQTYAKAKDVLEISDRDPNNFDNVWLIYNGASIKGQWQSPNYAREHVWAKSAFGGNHSKPDLPENFRGAASDLHNLRAINPSVNSTHSNYEFGDNNGLVVGEWRLLSLSSRPLNLYTPGKESEMTTNVFYPGNDHKGDVARIILYMMLMWDLTPREEISMLVQWHLDDPVDNFEIIRNEVIYKNQNNRNPFIDYPELVVRTFAN